MPRTPFDAWARFYDSAVPRDRPDRALFLDLSADAGGPVLELGCGAGDIYLDLVDAGVDAYGIDASTAMLDVLRENAADRGLEPRVTRADMTDFSFDVRFELILAPANAVRHLPALADQRAAFPKRARRPRGRRPVRVLGGPPRLRRPLRPARGGHDRRGVHTRRRTSRVRAARRTR